MKNLFRRLAAVLLTGSMAMGLFGISLPALAAEEINRSFRTLDDALKCNMEGSRTITVSERYTQGTGATKFTYTADQTGLYWFIYCSEEDNETGVDIAGATHISFDMFVSDASAWDIADGSAGINVRSVGSEGWISDCTSVSKDDTIKAFAGLQTGWNHVVLPLTEIMKPDAWALRI